MDKKEHGKEASEDVTRESLIAISDGAPDRTAKSMAGENVVEPLNCDADEKYRSKLISISSSSPSPNVKVQTVMPGQSDP
ncbi:hypothetical protein C2S51_011287 [Perilla frutescens var. frutescens]|nr:hypothetical protein C2S51_011287 [Perilla frutescens var. frutescens]